MDMDHVANKRRETEEEVRTSPFDLAMTTANVFWVSRMYGCHSLAPCDVLRTGTMQCMCPHWHHVMCHALTACNVCVTH
jgi:hypothetical protein